MYLKELRIHGFKSFADPLTLELDPGMTAIVGPNGCGKSNLADAIRWVLGEQSSKSMRAGSMQEVIFQGSSKRKALGFCEVSLLFADCEAQLGTTFAEVEVTRRVAREGGSDYYLNGKHCRLKDIQKLFFDTGVGQVAYSFMLQGQIDQILMSSPVERRGIFEEAAGISRYKAQRRETLNKLASVEADLTRVTDVLEEVTRQMASLRRQATKALRYRRTKHRLKHLDLALQRRSWEDFGTRIGDIQDRLNAQRAQAAELTAAENALDAAVVRHRETREELERQAAEARERAYERRNARDQASSAAELAQTRAEDAEGRRGRLLRELTQIATRRGELQGKLNGETAQRATEAAAVSGSDDDFSAREQALRTHEEALAEADRELRRLRAEADAQAQAITRARARTTELEIDQRAAEARLDALSQELHGLEGLMEDRAAELETLAQARKSLDARRSDLESERERRETVVRELREQFREKQREIQQQERAGAEARARAGALTSLQERFEGFSEGAKAILGGKLGPKRSAWRALSQGLRVEEPWLSAWETLLRVVGEVVVAAETADAAEALAELNEKGLGRAALLVDAGAGVSSRDVPEALTPAAQVVTGETPALARLLAGGYFCADFGAALDALANAPDFRFQWIAAGDGRYLDARGLMLGGSGGSGAGFLRREQEIAKLARQAESAESAAEKHRGEAEAIQHSLTEAEDAQEGVRTSLAETAEELANLEAQRREATRAKDSAEQRRETLSEERVKLQEKHQRAKEAHLQVRDSLAAAEQSAADARAAFEAAEGARQERQQACERARAEFHELRLAQAEKKHRLQVVERNLDDLRRQLGELDETERQHREETNRLEAQIEALQEEAQGYREEAAVEEKELKEALEMVETRQQRVREADTQARAQEEKLATLRRELHELEQAQSKGEIERARVETEQRLLREHAEEAHGTDLREIDTLDMLWQAGESLPERLRVDMEDDELDLASEIEATRPPPSEQERELLEDTDWAEVRREQKELAERIAAMGAVNLVAIEEFRALKERHEFLQGQSDDLWKAKEQLLAAIDEVNAASRERFEETFRQVQANFKFTFDTLFGGGEADLRLLDSEDPLEAGIEIVARPPGTKLRSLGLLSGGQKTMTAVALLFAIYMVKPSPFCVLDEIDAPLDDANIGRFTAMLRRFLDQSQFLIITHNKRTIAAADTLFGVTMQERGVSRLISMRLEGKGQPEPVEAAG